MLSSQDRRTMIAQAERTVDILGVPDVTWEQTKAPNNTKDELTVGFKTVGIREEELINAFGIGAKIITAKVSDIPLVEKFDRFTIMGEKYTIDGVNPVYINGVHVFHKCYVKGK